MRDILDTVYLDDLWHLTRAINTRKVGEYRVQLAIVQNPHTKNPRDLWHSLKLQDEEKRDERLDVVGFEAMKGMMRGNPRIIVK